MKSKIIRAEVKFVPVAVSRKVGLENERSVRFSLNGTPLNIEQTKERTLAWYETALLSYKSHRYILILLLLMKKLFNKALEHYGSALTLSLESSTLHYDLARVYHRQGLAKKAEEHVVMAKRLENESNGM